MRMIAGSCLLNVLRALRMLHSAVLSSLNPTKKGKNGGYLVIAWSFSYSVTLNLKLGHCVHLERK